MNKALLCAVMAAAVTTGATLANAADAPKKEKCYGIAKAGKNDCKAANGSHSCAGHATADNDKNEWNFVEAGKCAEQGGSTTPPEAAKK